MFAQCKLFVVAFALVLGGIVSCASSMADTSPQATPFATPRLAGLMTDVRLVEFSGMAVARRKNRFWAINDGGQAPVLWQIDQKGKIVAQLNKLPIESLID